MAGAIVLSLTHSASQEALVDSAQRVVVARSRAPRDAAVQLVSKSSALGIRMSSRGALGRPYSSRLYFLKLHHTLRMGRLTSMEIHTYRRGAGIDYVSSWLTWEFVVGSIRFLL